MVNSTEVASHFLGSEGVRKYYSLFINSIAGIARESGGKVLKNAGDCLVIYFPATSDTLDSASLQRAMDCCLEICDAHSSLTALAHSFGLPPINYRVSADYGTVELAKSKTSSEYDLIGPTMNLCSKINAKAKSNSMVIGGDLHGILTTFFSHKFGQQYRFEQVGEYSVGLKCAYPVFSVVRKSLPANTISDKKTDAESRTRLRVMIIDDEPDILMTFGTMLGSAERIEVESFTDPLEALRQFLAKNSGYYNLVVADIRMPRLNGIQLSKILKSLDRNIHILLVTAHDVIDEVCSLLPEVQRDDVIKKPVSQDTFLAKVRMAMAR
jgi:CheY-like chemotaxis protein